MIFYGFSNQLPLITVGENLGTLTGVLFIGILQQLAMTNITL
jgi:hypothetical protein